MVGNTIPPRDKAIFLNCVLRSNRQAWGIEAIATLSDFEQVFVNKNRICRDLQTYRILRFVGIRLFHREFGRLAQHNAWPCHEFIRIFLWMSFLFTKNDAVLEGRYIYYIYIYTIATIYCRSQLSGPTPSSPTAIHHHVV